MNSPRSLPGDLNSNIRHAHFISVLEEICETLEWQSTGSSQRDLQTSPSTSKNGADEEEDIETYLNKFAVLTVEEPQDLPETPSNETPMVKEEVVEEDADNQEEENLSQLFFQMFCLFRDLHNIRTFLSQTWEEYRNANIDLMNAAVVTDSALQLARDLFQDVMDGWPDKNIQRTWCSRIWL